MISVIHLPGGVQRRLNATFHTFLYGQNGSEGDFRRPAGEEALIPAQSVSWRVFKNPIALFVGGTAAVILELADPAVRAGVWEHSAFRKSPLGRLQRTGLAAMVTVFGARSVARPMIERVVRMHGAVRGETASGTRYSATDPRLLTWVHATAAFGFGEAYSRFVSPLDEAACNRLYLEGSPVSRLYGAIDAPQSVGEMRSLFESSASTLTPSPIVAEFLQIMRDTPAFPVALRWLQPMLVRAAVELIPGWIRGRLGLTKGYDLRPHERWLVGLLGASSDRLILPASPAVQSCLRLGLPAGYLYS
jgi:uncharacterized protein (DUF2236 family)